MLQKKLLETLNIIFSYGIIFMLYNLFILYSSNWQGGSSKLVISRYQHFDSKDVLRQSTDPSHVK
jgi:hypothetical protein